MLLRPLLTNEIGFQSDKFSYECNTVLVQKKYERRKRKNSVYSFNMTYFLSLSLSLSLSTAMTRVNDKIFVAS